MCRIQSVIAVTSFESAVSVWTIRGALVCMVVFFAFRLSRKKFEGAVLDLAKGAWLIGSLFSLLHAVATMAFHHQFQHQLAYEDTARQTQEAMGFAVGYGIWFNYAFVVVWLVDALWLNGFAASYISRHRGFNWLIYGFLGFIAFNGAIVFESGPIRWIGILATLLLIVQWKVSTASVREN